MPDEQLLGRGFWSLIHPDDSAGSAATSSASCSPTSPTRPSPLPWPTASSAAIDRDLPAAVHHVRVGCSIGIAMSTPGIDAKDLLRQADLAMDETKRLRRNGCHLFVAA